jgi:hypothetical protein
MHEGLVLCLRVRRGISRRAPGVNRRYDVAGRAPTGSNVIMGGAHKRKSRTRTGPTEQPRLRPSWRRRRQAEVPGGPVCHDRRSTNRERQVRALALNVGYGTQGIAARDRVAPVVPGAGPHDDGVVAWRSRLCSRRHLAYLIGEDGAVTLATAVDDDLDPVGHHAARSLRRRTRLYPSRARLRRRAQRGRIVARLGSTVALRRRTVSGTCRRGQRRRLAEVPGAVARCCHTGHRNGGGTNELPSHDPVLLLTQVLASLVTRC